MLLRIFRNQAPDLIEALSVLKKRALRKKVWFTSLNTEERILASLIKRNVRIVRNSTLATVMARMIGKLITGIKNAFTNRIDGMGRRIADSFSRSARSMGWHVDWDTNQDVIRWFGLTAFYSGRRMPYPGGFET